MLLQVVFISLLTIALNYFKILYFTWLLKFLNERTVDIFFTLLCINIFSEVHLSGNFQIMRTIFSLLKLYFFIKVV